MPFWETLAAGSKNAWQRLTDIVREVLCQGSVITQLDPEPGVHVAGIPVTCRQRIVGAVLTCALGPEFAEIDRIRRFSHRHELDGGLLECSVTKIHFRGEDEMRVFAEIISSQVESMRDQAIARRDIEDLSSQLANAYEQFRLLYRLNTEMTLSHKSTVLFKHMCEDLLAATVIESFAVVLSPDGTSLSEPTCIVSGPLDIQPAKLVRLHEESRRLPRNAGDCLVVNNVPERPELAWAVGWLNQFILFPLSSNDRYFGAILAINRRDGQDFGSEEVHFVGAVAQRASTFLENARLYDDLEQLFMGTLHALVSSIDAKDPYTCGHSQRVAWLARHIARLAGVTEEECQRAYLSGLLHDIGKIGVSEAVLRKEGLLTAEEYEEIKRHPRIGANILKGVRQIDDIVPGVLHHHDRYDGAGYPFTLKGEEIPLLGRIVCLADCFDAITTSRTYRKARPIEDARAELQSCAGSHFDPVLTGIFVQEDLRDVSREMARSCRDVVDEPAVC
ncbi:MAG: HD domain-containing phosphohydrolase [Phycisphaerae bacterium]